MNWRAIQNLIDQLFASMIGCFYFHVIHHCHVMTAVNNNFFLFLYSQWRLFFFGRLRFHDYNGSVPKWNKRTFFNSVKYCMTYKSQVLFEECSILGSHRQRLHLLSVDSRRAFCYPYFVFCLFYVEKVITRDPITEAHKPFKYLNLNRLQFFFYCTVPWLQSVFVTVVYDICKWGSLHKKNERPNTLRWAGLSFTTM